MDLLRIDRIEAWVQEREPTQTQAMIALQAREVIEGDDFFDKAQMAINQAKLAEFRAAHDDYSDILLKALADRFAEAAAEALHFRIRTDHWGYERLAVPDYPGLIREQYQGIRPAPGYPACPDHSLKPLLFDLLDAYRRRRGRGGSAQVCGGKVGYKRECHL